MVQGVEVDEPGSGGSMLIGGGVRERERVGVGVVIGGGVAGGAGVGGETGGEFESKVRRGCRRDKRASSAVVPRM